MEESNKKEVAEFTSKPYDWLTEDSRLFLKRDYLEKDVTPEQRVRDGIAKSAERILTEMYFERAENLGTESPFAGFACKFENYMSKGFYSLATPVWINFGNDRGLPVSCFGSYIDDSVESILEKMAEIGTMTKNGGGCSAFYGGLRKRGALIKEGRNGASAGPIPFMELGDAVTNIISQGSARRGYLAAYLPIEHGDVEEFLRIRSEGNSIQNISIGITITDDWMKSMLGGDKKKRVLWAAIVQKRFETGFPYIMFIDNVNNQAPQVYLDKLIKIYASNMCVIGSERVVTNCGMLTAKDLYLQGDELTLFNNEKTVHATPMNLIEKDANVYRIELENGLVHTVTNYHDLLTDGGKVKCKDIKLGDRIAFQTQKGLFGNLNFEKEAFLLGLYQTDGVSFKDDLYFCLQEANFNLIEEVQDCHNYICDKYEHQANLTPENSKFLFKAAYVDVRDNRIKKEMLASNVVSKILNFEKGRIPNWIWEAGESTQWQYLRGLFYTNDDIHTNINSRVNLIDLSLSSTDKEFLQNIQIISLNLGLQASIHLVSKKRMQFLPDAQSCEKQYAMQDCWKIVIKNKVHKKNTKKFSEVVGIRAYGKEDVYCCTVDDPKHLWVCNGVVTGNCAEICLHSSPTESFVCVLSSVNVEKWDEIVETDAIQVLVYFLDAVNEEFIRKARNLNFMEAAVRFAENQRALGMGALGWCSLLQSKMIPFESWEAKTLNNTIWKTMRARADEATEFLATALGEPKLLTGYKRRNVTTLAVAPTTSSGKILGTSPSVEVWNGNYFVEKTSKGSFTQKNKHLALMLQPLGLNTDEIWMSILNHGGSVQHLNLDDNTKAVFKTFGEVSQKEIVIQAVQRQKYIDQGQSLNLMIHPDTPPKEVSQLLIFGWENGIKTFYYQRNYNAAQELFRKLGNKAPVTSFECESCSS